MIPDNATDIVNRTTASAALISPLWIHTLSDFFTVWLPILGGLYLLLQIGVWSYKNFYKNPFWKVTK